MKATAKRMARRSSHYTAPTSTLVKQDRHILSRQQAKRTRDANFENGSYLAAASLCVLFLVMTLGSWWFGW